ncbi:MAG: DUF1275 domain-containing protein [Alphaproteobacteria bacterium]|nr:MAG: DUF1275 domain-containing protein [Alphaproteobacteria bacterium]
MSALGFISGFVDTLGFIALFGLFAAHITGNVVLIAASIVDHRYGIALKLMAIPTFIVAAIVTRFFIIRRERQLLDATTPVLLAEAALLAGFMAMALASAPFDGRESPAAIATGLLAAAAMGVQNTAARTFLMMQIIVDIVDLLHGHGDLHAKRERLSKLVPLMLAFGAGALLGAVGYVVIGFLALVAPIAAAAALGLLGRPHPAAVA